MQSKKKKKKKSHSQLKCNVQGKNSISEILAEKLKKSQDNEFAKTMLFEI